MKKIIFTTAMFVFSFQTIAFCQTDSALIKTAVSKLKTLLTDHTTEKAYLHFDRPYYLAGDIIYFKAYVTMGERHELTNISGMLHVDLVDKNDVAMQSEVIQLKNGTGWGDFALPDTLQKGSYRVRAYTEWMRNEKNPNFFAQYLSVSSINNIGRNTEAVRPGTQPNLQFFPEGGSMVTGVRSKVAFKAINPNGLGMSARGVVVDNGNKEMAEIVSGRMGMGVFDFIPEEGKTYKAKVAFADGSQNIVDLPAVEAKGITLSVNTVNPGKVSIEIKANQAYFKENLNKELNLLIYCAGVIKTYSFKLDNQVLGLDLPASNFRTGILKVSLLSQTGEPLNERIAFIQNPDLLNLSISANKPIFAKRENVQLNFNAKNKDGNPASGYFSVSVVDESKILADENTENTILSYLLLTSELKGNVEKPNYYFSSSTKETRANLDALMLTQGYRRFVWKELLNDNSNAVIAYKPEQYLDIAGTLKTKDGVPIAHAKIILLPVVQTETTDAQGRFRFARIDFQNGTNFILKTPSSSGKNAAVLVLDKPSPAPIITPENLTDAKYNADADILASFQNNQAQGVMMASSESGRVSSQETKVADNYANNYRSSNLGGAGHADQVIRGDYLKNASSLSNGLNGVARMIDFVHGVPYLKGNMIVSPGSVYHNAAAAGSMSGTSPSNNSGINESMLVVVDGTNVGTGISIDDISPNTVETVEILKGSNSAIYGTAGSAGVMVITTRQGGERTAIESKEMTPGVFSITPPGYYKAREFYSPRYDAGQSASRLPDVRSTIFWKPDVTTNADGIATLNYFNADGAGTYKVIVEGIDNKGNLGRQVFRYKVE